MQLESFALEKGCTYVIKEKIPNRAYRIFSDAISQGARGLIVTRIYPPKLKSKYEIRDSVIYWLTNVRMDIAIRPKDLEELSFKLEKFILANEGAIIIIDGLEYMITNNDFTTVLKFVQSLRDQVAIKNAILLISINPLTVEPHNLKLLEEEADYVI
ncbi:MAG: DUF835 domain-containing protein [Methanomassiliicoccales archaeon]|jgi:hypothetical protein|nr:DUF835 domain-containing protein [Methanomassiliicoccales archaeon]